MPFVLVSEAALQWAPVLPTWNFPLIRFFFFLPLFIHWMEHNGWVSHQLSTVSQSVSRLHTACLLLNWGSNKKWVRVILTIWLYWHIDHYLTYIMSRVSKYQPRLYIGYRLQVTHTSISAWRQALQLGVKLGWRYTCFLTTRSRRQPAASWMGLFTYVPMYYMFHEKVHRRAQTVQNLWICVM